MTVALVTGANRGLGFATSKALAQAGYCVVLTARRRDRAESAAAELRANGLDVQAAELDVTSARSIAAARDQIERTVGRLDVLVNNAGILPEATDATDHEFADLDTFRSTFETNVFGAVAVTEALLPLLRRSAMGRIVNVSSTMGSLGDQADPSSPYFQTIVPAYQSSKAALNSITISLSKRLADSGITVTSVCPGFVQTDLTPINREQAPLTASQAAAVVVAAATLPADARSGTFVDSNGPVAW
ncbi:SDR family NAD(P)-dependent oxidoreductase [Antrihabitans cavernicola]|uniref:SDR family NAD(P)-dependent oxidoreductase n=1 Tax=Antrihabitans cavernicola TaxID=2495913 RepID=A0A5A7SFL9_9NOCA|nr:SDR family NAD(P)-dependent oxidoreductase [Spelaeibacter cavernicola]KAA0023041.1 SDR family NAD(P)-dependent oxidoreductase [Spelaeibacter cavernicola]